MFVSQYEGGKTPGTGNDLSQHNMLNIPSGFCFSLSLEITYVCFLVNLRLLYILLHLCLPGIPDCSEEDLSVARALNLTWTTVLKSDVDEAQTLINSDEVWTVNYDSTPEKIIFLCLLLPVSGKNIRLFFSSFVCSSQASPDRRRSTPLPRRPENRRLAVTSPAPSSGTGWYQGSGIGGHPFLWCIVGLAVQLLSLRMSCLFRYQNCLRSRGKVRHHWRLLTTGSTASVQGGRTETCVEVIFIYSLSISSHLETKQWYIFLPFIECIENNSQAQANYA